MEQAAALTAASSFIASSKHGKKLPSAASRQPSAHRVASAAVAAPSQLGWEVTDGDAMAASSTCNDAGGRDDGKDGGGDVVGGGNGNMVVEDDGSGSNVNNSRVARASAPRILMMLPEYHVEGWGWDEKSLERPQGSDMESRAGDADAVKSLGQQQQQEHSCKPCLPFERGSVRGMLNELVFATPVTRRPSGGGSPGAASTTSTQSSGLRMPLPPFYVGVTTATAAATAADRPYSASATHTPVRRPPSAVAASPGSFAHSPLITSAVPSSPQLASRTGRPLAESIEVPETASASGHGSNTGDGGCGNDVGGNGGDSRAGGSGGGAGGSYSAVAAELLRRHGGSSSPLRPLPASVLPSSVRRHGSSSSHLPQHPPPLSTSPDDVTTATAAETTIATASSSCSGSGSGSGIVHPLVSNRTVSRPSNSNDMSRTDLMTETQHRQTRRLKPGNPSQRSLAFVLPPVSSTVDSVPQQQRPPPPQQQQQQQQRGSSLLSSQASFRAVTKTFRNMLYSFSSFRASLSRTTSASSIGSAGPFWEDALEGRSLLLFGHNSRLRHATAELVHNSLFEMIVLLLILASCVSLVLNSPGLDPDSRMAKALQILDYIFTGAFTLEAILKIVTFGFAFTGKHAYIRSGWNVLDFLIVLLGWALIVVEIVGHGNAESFKVLRVLRALRALRPLRAVQRFAGLRVVVDTLFAVLPSMINVALVCAFFYLIFAILAVNLFKGKLFNCIDAASGERIDPYYVLPPGQVLTRSWCEAGNQTISQSVYYSSRNLSSPMPDYMIVMQWVNPKANFDNVGAAMLALFQTATLSLWVDITFSAVDAVGVDKQPLWNHNPWVILFFVAFVVVCSFFVLNLFIGVTLDKFAELHQDQQTAGTFLTPQQQSWVKVQRLLLRSEVPYVPPRPPNRFRGMLYSLVSGRGFDVMMLVVILANVVFIAMVHADMSGAWQAVMSYSNLVFTCIFVIEAALKMTAFGPRGYFHDSWNRFDFFVVAVSVVSVVLDFSDTRNLSFMPVLRVLRVVRVVRLVRQAKGMQKLLRTLITSLPALVNVGGVMLLIFFIFAVIGVNLFAGIKHGDNLDSHANFDTFPNAMLLLFRMLTGEGWDAIMQDCMNMVGCVLVLQDFNVTATTTATTTAITTASLQLPVNTNATSPANSSTVISLLAGTYLDPSDPLLSSLPSNATQNQCPLSPVAAIVYFPTFVVLCTFILLQLVIAVLRENLIESDSDGDDGSAGGAAQPVPQSAMESFTKAWRAAVVKAAKGGGGQKGGGSSRGLLHASQLPRVLEATQPPLGASGSPCPRQEVQKLLLHLRIPLYAGNKVSFMETLHALASRVCATPLPTPEQDKLHRDLSKKLPRSQPHSKFTAAHYHAANSVAAAIRGFLLRHNLRDQLGIPVGPGGRLNQEQRRQNQANQQQQQQQLNGGELRGRLVIGEIGGPNRSRSPSRSRALHRLPSASSSSKRLPPIVSPNGAVVQRPGGIASRPGSAAQG
ncbi:hypothetical protein Vretimale_19881 [Volvox reticuliferus]|uniref:Ion transport domain-containing protein n=1 Tax=Volvox reticuliferus TaxID=1737510 RepID=A0A8J4H1L8_9CHLO|nr:hypothetical protein Vretifemale_20870 [Volvox reticuliferus]GIM17341.1 hypothetical protein Vretimale_19881 [Volvox reticuliferus]